MPIIYTTPASTVFESGKSLGQIGAEKEQYTRGVEQARLEMQQKQIKDAQTERALARIDADEKETRRQLEWKAIQKKQAEQFKTTTEEGTRQFDVTQKTKGIDVLRKLQDTKTKYELEKRGYAADMQTKGYSLVSQDKLPDTTKGNAVTGKYGSVWFKPKDVKTITEGAWTQLSYDEGMKLDPNYYETSVKAGAKGESIIMAKKKPAHLTPSAKPEKPEKPDKATVAQAIKLAQDILENEESYKPEKVKWANDIIDKYTGGGATTSKTQEKWWDK